MSMLDLSYAVDATVYFVNHHVDLFLVVTIYAITDLYVLNTQGDSREMWIFECDGGCCE